MQIIIFQEPQARNQMVDFVTDSETEQSHKESSRRLNQFDLFQGIPEIDMKGIARQTTWRSVSAGNIIPEASSESDDLLLLLSGRANVVNATEDRVPLRLDNLNAGEFCGGLSAIDGQSNITTVVAENECVYGALNGEVFLELAIRHKKTILRVLENLARRIRNTEARYVSASWHTAEQRVCRELLRHVTPDPVDSSRYRIFPVPTQAHIAETIGVTRQTVARIFGQLIRQQVVNRRGRVLHIENLEELEAIAAIETAT